MATDNTPPRLKLIITIAAITVITLVGIDFILKSYYGMMTDQAQREKNAPTRDKDEQRKAEQAALTGATIPIDQAMGQLSKGGRAAEITPQPSDDIGAMTGWSKLPKPAPVPQPHGAAAAEPTAGGDAGVSGDGGAAAGSDGGAAAGGDAGAAHRTGDAGAPRAGADAGARHPHR